MKNTLKPVNWYHPASRGIIFDMDGVLFDTEKDSIPLIISIGAEMGFAITREFVIQNMGRNMAEESVIYKAHLGDAFDADYFWKRYWDLRNKKYDREGMPVKAGAMKLLITAREKAIPCVVASSSPSEQVVRALKKAGVYEYFTGVVGGEMFERSKPEPDIFLAAARIIHLFPEQCLIIEDSLNGLKAAGATGSLVVFVKDIPSYPVELLKEYAHYSFDSAEEIKELL